MVIGNRIDINLSCDCRFFMSSQHNICILKPSKLWVERTRKSLAQNSRVLSSLRYIVENHYVATLVLKIGNAINVKNTPFNCKMTTFAFHFSLVCIATVVLLHFNCSPFAMQRSLEWILVWYFTSKNRKSPPQKSLESIFVL